MFSDLLLLPIDARMNFRFLQNADGLKNENFARNIVAANKIVNASPFILNIDKRLAICR